MQQKTALFQGGFCFCVGWYWDAPKPLYRGAVGVRPARHLIAYRRFLSQQFLDNPTKMGDLDCTIRASVTAVAVRATGKDVWKD